LEQQQLEELRLKAKVIRRHIIKMTGEAGSGHPGGSLSAADIVTALYFKVMRLDPENPGWEERDRFVLSKGHAAPLLYAALAERGFFPVAELATLRKLGSPLQGRPDMRKLPGVEMSTGSLGQGLSAANGMALAGKLDGRDYRVYVLLGDGESQEGQIWEAAMAAAHYRLDNVTAFLDHNGFQIDGPVIEIDGHDFEQILSAVEEACGVKGRPTMVVAKTVKGKGVSFMENQVDWHGVAPNAEQVKKALAELS